MAKFQTWQEYLIERLASNEEAAASYVDVCLEGYQEDGDTAFFLKGIGNIITAKGGVAAIAEKADMTPETLSEVLASEEAPRLDTLRAILGALGYRLASQPLTAENTEQDIRTENVAPTPQAAAESRDSLR